MRGVGMAGVQRPLVRPVLADQGAERVDVAARQRARHLARQRPHARQRPGDARLARPVRVEHPGDRRRRDARLAGVDHHEPPLERAADAVA
jgi:hypothetical protein